MGGFRIDGCGTKEYFKKVKYLGERNCPKCKRNTPYYLEKANYKVSVFYIPTVTLKERYAIICERCDYGKYIEDAEAYKILSGDSNTSLNTENTNDKTEERHENLMNKKTCPKCGAEIDGMFCGACGTKYVELKISDPIPEPPTPQPVPEAQEWECPLCGTKNPKSATVCGLCGDEKPKKQ